MPLVRRVFKHLCRYQYLWHCLYYFNMCICRLTSFIYLVWKKWGMLIASWSIVWIQALTMSNLCQLHKTACPPWSLPFCTHACYLKTSAGTRSTPSFAVLIKTNFTTVSSSSLEEKHPVWLFPCYSVRAHCWWVVGTATEQSRPVNWIL